MRIASWNVNGVRARLDNLIIWLIHNQPDIVCLQETKSTDEQFPRAPIEALGYHVETHGQKGFNGVALLSRTTPKMVRCSLPGNETDEQARFIEGVYSMHNSVIRIASLYLPNGNPVKSVNYTYKISWMKRLRDFAEKHLRHNEVFILAGDYNVISTDMDAENPTDWVDDALSLSPTRIAFRELINLGLTDAIRSVALEKEYTFWDYRGQAWERNNGIRIDHILLSEEARRRLTDAFIQKEIRGWRRTSDHVPVWVGLAC